MQDNRATPRREIERTARIELSDGSQVDCTLADVSQAGARIAIGDAAAIPDEFILVLRDDLRRHCRAIRRSGQSLGVMFVANPSAGG